MDSNNATFADCRIFLAGFMGSGKSTVGPLLAERVGLPFVDLDDVVAESAGYSIGDIFAADGEARFRALESLALRASTAPGVYALGGGALGTAGNLAWTLRAGTLVYLEAAAEELTRRLLDSESARPLLLDDAGRRLSPSVLAAKVSHLLAARGAAYRRAHVTVRTDGRSAQQTVRAGVAALRRHLAESRNDFR